MSSTTSLSIHIHNIYNSQGITWNNTSLIQMESILFLSFGFIHKSFFDFMTIVYYSVCLILNLFHLTLSYTLIVCYVQMSLFSCLLGSILPYMWSQHSSTRSKDHMSTSVMRLQLTSSFFVNSHLDALSFNSLYTWNIFV